MLVARFLFDQEFFLNLGCDLAIAAFLVLLMLCSTELVMRFSILIFAGTQPLMLFLANKIERAERE